MLYPVTPKESLEAVQSSLMLLLDAAAVRLSGSVGGTLSTTSTW
jgi:hypothetical protein